MSYAETAGCSTGKINTLQGKLPDECNANQTASASGAQQLLNLITLFTFADDIAVVGTPDQNDRRFTRSYPFTNTISCSISNFNFCIINECLVF